MPSAFFGQDLRTREDVQHAVGCYRDDAEVRSYWWPPLAAKGHEAGQTETRKLGDCMHNSPHWGTRKGDCQLHVLQLYVRKTLGNRAQSTFQHHCRFLTCSLALPRPALTRWCSVPSRHMAAGCVLADVHNGSGRSAIRSEGSQTEGESELMDT